MATIQEWIYSLISLIPLVLSYLIFLDTKKDIRAYGQHLNGSRIYLERTNKIERNRVVGQALLALPGITSLFLPPTTFTGSAEQETIRFALVIMPFFLVQLVMLANSIMTRNLRKDLIEYVRMSKTKMV